MKTEFLDPPFEISTAPDEVTRLLIKDSFVVRPARLNPQPYSKIIGNVIDDFHGSKITYRIENQGQHLNLIFYELVNQQNRSLRNSFLGFEQFLDWLVLNPTGISRLQGAIHELSGGGLATERISRFYKKILCGRTLEWRDGQEIIYTEMDWWKVFRGLKAVH